MRDVAGRQVVDSDVLGIVLAKAAEVATRLHLANDGVSYAIAKPIMVEVNGRIYLVEFGEIEVHS